MAKRSKKTRPIVEIGNEVNEQLTLKANLLLKDLLSRKDIQQVVAINKYLNDALTKIGKADDGTVDKVVGFYNDYGKAKTLGEKEQMFKNFSQYQAELRLRDLVIDDED